MAKILIVDDSEVVRNLVTETLVAAGHTLIDAVDGDDGYDKIMAHPDLDIVISDYNMPGIDGITMLRKARQALGTVKYTVFILTTETSDNLKHLGREADVMAWIIKPFSGPRLTQAISKVLSLKKR